MNLNIEENIDSNQKISANEEIINPFKDMNKNELSDQRISNLNPDYKALYM